MTDESEEQVASWQATMEALVIGALRGMALSHAEMAAAHRGKIPPLDDLAMFHAAEVLAATLLEASAECRDERAFAKASKLVGRHVYQHMKTLRSQRGSSDTPLLNEVLESAGLERHRLN
jgi:hypothetical protein